MERFIIGDTCTVYVACSAAVSRMFLIINDKHGVQQCDNKQFLFMITCRKQVYHQAQFDHLFGIYKPLELNTKNS